jgi:hypothetical protein
MNFGVKGWMKDDDQLCIGPLKDNLVPGVGIEPTWIAPADFKSAASADSATPALTIEWRPVSFYHKANCDWCA